ncbi:hypothetical protein JXQ70_16055 [bacterium]|nr:hypothetical protein [bacterium]
MEKGTKTPRNLKRLGLVLAITAALALVGAAIGFGLVGCSDMDQDESPRISEVDLLNKAIADAGAYWVAAETWVSQLPLEERQKLYGLPNRPEQADTPIDEIAPTMGQQSFPERFDWRNNQGANWMSGIRNQKQCGSCVVMCIVGVMEPVIRIADGNPDETVNLSEQHLCSCVNGSCETGWWYGAVLDYLVNSGVPDEDCFPYKGQNLPCSNTCSDWQSRAVKIDAYWEIGKSIDAIKQEVMRAPITTSFSVYHDFNSYKGGVYEYVSGAYEGGHAVVIIGWDDNPPDAPGKSCWICRNSWGPNWGEGEGYFRILWGNCGIGQDDNYAMSYSGSTPPPPPPTKVKAINRYSQGVAGASLRRIDISWNEEPSGSTYGFHVYKSNTNSYSGMSRLTQASSPVKTNHYEYTPSSGDTDQVFYFAVTAALATGAEGDYSNIAQNVDP